MKFTINKPIRLIELFAGIGSQAMALRDIGADFEHYRGGRVRQVPRCQLQRHSWYKLSYNGYYKNHGQ